MRNLILLALPLLATASTIPGADTKVVKLTDLEKRADCKLTAHYRDDWQENGAKRFRVKFSTDPNNSLSQSFCDSFGSATCHRIGGWENLQCGWDSGVDGGSWRVDYSTANTDLGYNQYKNCMQEAANEWRRRNPCDVDSSW